MATYIWVYIWAQDPVPLNCLDYHSFIVKIWNQEVFQEYLGYSSSFSFPYTFLLKLVRLGGKKDLYWYFDWDTWFSVNIHDHESQGDLFWNPAIILHSLHEEKRLVQKLSPQFPSSLLDQNWAALSSLNKWKEGLDFLPILNQSGFVG